MTDLVATLPDGPAARSTVDPHAGPAFHDERRTLSVLVVCSGNLVRSPLAAQLLERRLADRGILAHVTSAGTVADDGAPMASEAAELSRRLGGAPDGHRARALDESMLAEADLVLTASREHRATVASMLPRAVRRAFTLRELARISDATDDEAGGPRSELGVGEWSDVVAELAAQRGIVPLPAPPEDDIPDPYGRSPDAYAEAAGLIDEAVDSIVRGLVRRGGGAG